MRVGQLLRAWRRIADLTLDELAQQIDISVSALSRIERGQTMDGATLAKILIWLAEPV